MRETAFLAAEPQLFVADVAASIAFYVNRLGFEMAFSHGEPAFYAQVARGGARLNLRCVDSAVIEPERRERDVLLSASITVADADAVFAEYSQAGVEFAQAIRSEAWGARGFIVRDVDGNLILFAGRQAGGLLSNAGVPRGEAGRL